MSLGRAQYRQQLVGNLELLRRILLQPAPQCDRYRILCGKTAL